MAIVTTNKGSLANGVYSFCQTETQPYMFTCTTTDAYYLDGQSGAFTHITDPNFPTVGNAGCSFTGAISLTTLTVSVISVGALTIGQYINGSGILSGTYIVAQLTGSAGSTGTYQVSISQTVVSEAMTISPTAIRNLAYGTVYMDGIVYVLTVDGRIYGSNNENVTNGNWNPLNYLTKSSEPDGGLAIVKHLNYVVAYGAWSTEFFYNAGNPYPFSSLSRYDIAKSEIGCAVGSSVVQFSQTVAWVGQSRETGRGVFLLDGLSPTKISNTAIEFYLNNSTLANVRAWAITVPGHTFYVLTLQDLKISLVFDLKEKEWYQWTTTNQSGTNLTEKELDSAFFASLGGVAYTLDESDGSVYQVSNNFYTDGDGPISYRVVTTNIGETNSNKFFHSLELIGDRVGATMKIRHSDDDYSSWSPYRQVSLVNSRPIIYIGGRSRRRAYEFYCTDNQPLRLHSVEFNVKEGSS